MASVRGTATAGIRLCACRGVNPNCFKCGGRGSLQDPWQRPDAGSAERAPAHRSKQVAPLAAASATAPVAISGAASGLLEDIAGLLAKLRTYYCAAVLREPTRELVALERASSVDVRSAEALRGRLRAQVEAAQRASWRQLRRPTRGHGRHRARPPALRPAATL